MTCGILLGVGKNRVSALMRGFWGRGGLKAGGPAGDGTVGMTGHNFQTTVMPPGAGSQVEEGTAPVAEARENGGSLGKR